MVENRDRDQADGIKGAVESVKGRLKQAAGTVAGQDSLEREGQQQREKGQAQQEAERKEAEAEQARQRAAESETRERREQDEK
ncbi:MULTISPECIES: microaggregate-binding protein 1 [Prauserella salsuginis group]|uniref:Uncharacterized protein YjbJ (UPF0337 family) n=2 Tax=Prauserella salsuginis group TaxID=2893672 RepID=A0A839XNJ3_9PSEU|nr:MULTISPECIES: CsbD family protein [Prauserella salsuginis group]MBB3662273.1 uncharacterized protein YjbJ (UPF0337 family) [Prauserella sediminis]MCR3719986.1 CsbD-like [Prauserella flava]MCR3736470.1 CsbD-like [Prauserella salsuginis]